MKANYCHICAQPVTTNERGYPVCTEHGVLWLLQRNSLCGEVFIVREDGKLLLIKRANDPFSDYWALPGGFSEYGEHPAETAKREALEETGWTVELTGSIVDVNLDSFPDDPQSEHRVVVSYLAKPISQIDEVDDETLGQEWVDAGSLPENIVPAQLARITNFFNTRQ